MFGCLVCFIVSSSVSLVYPHAGCFYIVPAQTYSQTIPSLLLLNSNDVLKFGEQDIGQAKVIRFRITIKIEVRQ
jgi:hypothetical protein